MKYRIPDQIPRRIKARRKLWTVVAIIVLVVGLFAAWRLHDSYERNLRPVSSQTASQYFTVQPGESLDQIAHSLQDAGLIRSWGAFEAYIRINELRSNLQAGTYSLSPSMAASQIANEIANGEVAKNLLTILPGKRLDQVEQEFIDAGYTKAQVTSALQTSHYLDDSVLSSLPAGRSLEGYLFPDSFQRLSSTPASTIIRESIDELGTNLTPQIVAGFKKQGLSIYQGITLASIVEQESGRASDDPTIAQVFLLRLHDGMPLGSDVTAKYASAIAGKPFDPTINSPYNTRVVKGLPPGPIGTVSADALAAVAAPAHTTYLYFVTGDNGITYFSYTEAQHEDQIQKYCIKACQ